MRHGVDGRKFGRNTSHRLALFKNLANAVILEEQITTTVPKAKEVRRVVDRLITLAKRGTPASRRLVFDRTRNAAVVKKLFDVLVPRYKDRAGGYTRVLKKADLRWGDAAEMALFELVDHGPIIRKRKKRVAEGEEKNAKGKDEPVSGTETTAKPSDPLGRFRRLFSGTRKKAQAQSRQVQNRGGSNQGNKTS